MKTLLIAIVLSTFLILPVMANESPAILGAIDVQHVQQLDNIDDIRGELYYYNPDNRYTQDFALSLVSNYCNQSHIACSSIKTIKIAQHNEAFKELHAYEIRATEYARARLFDPYSWTVTKKY